MSTKQVDVEEQAPTGDGLRHRQVKRDTICMEDFFELNDIDKSTQDMFVEYDKQGEGTFTKNEVLNIITDLKKSANQNQELSASNRMMKKMLFGAVVFFFLLVGSLFGVSIAVATLTKETSIQDGTLYNKDGSAVVATDSRADLFEVDSFDFGDCLSVGDVETIKDHVEQGKNVIVSRHNVDGASHQLEMLSPSGATFNDETGVACYPMPEKPGKVYCVFPDSDVCEEPDNRRRLKSGQCNNANSNSPACRPVPTCECNVVPTCLTEPGTFVSGVESQCIDDDSCMLSDCTFQCPDTSGNGEGDPCHCDGTMVCFNVMVPDCSHCRT